MLLFIRDNHRDEVIPVVNMVFTMQDPAAMRRDTLVRRRQSKNTLNKVSCINYYYSTCIV